MRGPKKRLTPFGMMVVKALADRDMSRAELAATVGTSPQYMCHFILKLADIIKIYADVLECVSRPFLVALMHFNPADKVGENGGGKLGKGRMAFRQLQKLLRLSLIHI